MRALVLSLAFLLVVPLAPTISAGPSGTCIPSLEVCVELTCGSLRECLDPNYACPGGPPCPYDPDV